MANYEEPSLLDFSGNYLHANVQVSFTCALVILHFYLRVCCVCVWRLYAYCVPFCVSESECRLLYLLA